MSTNAPLVIRTGLPGNGKTINTIKELDKQGFEQDRPIYYHNITGLKPEKLKANWFEFEDPLLWYELPNDSIIVVDEAQGDSEHQRFGVRDPRKAVPLHISKIELIRHRGQELHLITQDPRFLDVHVRRLCNCHINYWRAFGSNQIVRYVMPRVKDDVEKLSSFKGCEKTIVKLDSKLFDVYQSAQAGHHFKFKIPFAAWLLLGCAVVFGVMAYSLRDRFGASADESPADAPGIVSEAIGNIAGDITGGPGGKPKLDYFDQLKPRIADIPSTAPAYDELTKPVSYPKTYCVLTYDQDLIERNQSRMMVSVSDDKAAGCQCYTQQNTIVKTSFSFCVDVVKNGRFDSAIADRGQQVAQAVPPSVGSPGVLPASQPTALMSEPVSSLTVVPDSEYSSRPWR